MLVIVPSNCEWLCSSAETCCCKCGDCQECGICDYKPKPGLVERLRLCPRSCPTAPQAWRVLGGEGQMPATNRLSKRKIPYYQLS